MKDYIKKIMAGFESSSAIEPKFQIVDGQETIIFSFFINDDKVNCAMFISENDDFILGQIFFRYNKFIKDGKLGEVLLNINKINSISIGGFLCAVEDKNTHYVHYKENIFISKNNLQLDEVIRSNVIAFVNVNIDLINAFNEELFS